MVVSTRARSQPPGKAPVLQVPASGLERSLHGQGARPGGAAGEGPSGLLSGPARDFAPSTSSNLGIRRRDGRMDGWLPSRLRPRPLAYCYSSTFGNTQNSFLLKTTHIIEVLKLQDSPWCRGWSLDTSEKFPCSSFYTLCFALSKPFHR